MLYMKANGVDFQAKVLICQFLVICNLRGIGVLYVHQIRLLQINKPIGSSCNQNPKTSVMSLSSNIKDSLPNIRPTSLVDAIEQ